MTPEQGQAFYRSEISRYQALVKATHFKPQ
jgi:hypothetical protein